MATTVFLWEGKSRQGNVQKAEISANNKEEVMTLLRKQNITPVNVTAKPREIKLGFGEPKVTDKDVVQQQRARGQGGALNELAAIQ